MKKMRFSFILEETIDSRKKLVLLNQTFVFIRDFI